MLKQIISVFIAAVFTAIPAFAGTTLLWHTTSQNTFFSASGNSMGVGTENAASACSAFAANNFATIEVGGWTNGGGTPWPASASGWTVLFSAVDTNTGDTGGAVLYKKLTGSETCPITVANGGGSTATGGQSWQLQVWACTGTPPTPAVDPNSAMAGGYLAPGPGNQVAPTTGTLTNSNDIDLVVYFDQGYGTPYVQPSPGYTAIDDTMGAGAGGNGATEILSSYKVLSSTAPTGNINSPTLQTFNRYVGTQVAINVCTSSAGGAPTRTLLGVGK